MSDTVDNEFISNQKRKNETIFPTIVRFALISTLIGILYSMILYITDNHYNMWLGLLALIIPCIVVFFTISSYRTKNNDVVSFGRAFLVGISFFILVLLLSWAFNYLYTNVIIPNYWDGMIDHMEEMFEGFGMSDVQIEKSLSKMEKNKNNHLMQLLNLFTPFAIFGSIFSAIAGAIFKKAPKTQF